MFLEKRVYQGSSGRVYPLPFIDRISTEKRARPWQALHIENEFVRLMVLPEIGGRIHIGLDKTNDYDFFYRQNVIKPALVGLAGPWISGGVEFNWPQHHRPATFMPMEWGIERHADGSATIWCSDHDPMNRLKGMHGLCLHSGKSYVELKVRLYNRTPVTQTFLWWANIGVHVHELYQSFFPSDVRFVFDHARRAVSTFPLCVGTYYGVDYGRRMKYGISPEQLPAKFVPPGTYAPNDLSWYANIPVPTSYMAVGSKEDFHGGYDHRARAGVVLIADHHIAPGKKQWTWGNHNFGYAWDRNLTDGDGPYVELMAGVFSDNQPDFSFLAPGETKVFSQYWYPIREIGPAQKANLHAALSLNVNKHVARLGICVTEKHRPAHLQLHAHGKKIAEFVRSLFPGTPFIESITLPGNVEESGLSATLTASDGRELLRYTPPSRDSSEAPKPATEPLLPEAIASLDELYTTGLHLEQYRHATRYPEAYWREALNRDPVDSRCNNALGLSHLRRGELREAEKCFRNAIRRLTMWNSNPYNGEAYYNLGLTLQYLGRDEDAYDALWKATWNLPWSSAAHLAIAELDVKRELWTSALNHLQNSLKLNSDHCNARNLLVVVLRKIGRSSEARTVLQENLALDPMNSWARYLKTGLLPASNGMSFDLALDFARAGLYTEATEVLQGMEKEARDGSLPIMWYALGHFERLLGHPSASQAAYDRATQSSPNYCFPNRLEELIILQAATAANPKDARARYYLGNLLYDRRRHREAIEQWELSADADPSFATVWRNLGIGYFNSGNPEEARKAFDRAIGLNPHDGRVLYERDQLWKRIDETPQKRLREFDKFADLVQGRDDLSVELAELFNQTGQHEKALSLLKSRKFQPWEGGEGLVVRQHVRTHLALGRQALMRGNIKAGQRFFGAALRIPENLSEDIHPLANQSDIFYWLGTAAEMAGDSRAARSWWERASQHQGDFQEMRVKSFSEMTYYKALAAKRLGKNEEAEKLLRDLLGYADDLAKRPAKIDYFATSLPSMLLFEDDPENTKTVTALFLQAQARLGLGEVSRAQDLLHQVLLLDGNHSMAADLLAAMQAIPTTV